MRLLREQILCLGILLLTFSTYAQNEQSLFQTVRGTVIDKSLQTTLPFSSVLIVSDSSTKGAICDEEGRFKLEKVPVGRHTLKITSFGYKDLIFPVLVNSGKEVVITLEMEEDIKEVDEIVIEATKDKGVPNNNLATNSITSMRPEEINRFAGSRSDPSRMASNYAGVAGGADLRNDIIVRGNSPIGVLWRLEGVDIPNPNHFSFTGNTGGAFSILNNNILANSDFLTGAFPAEYGNKTAAVFDVRMRKGNNEKREHTFQIGLNGIEFGTEGPIKKGNASYLANIRFLTFEAIDKLGISIGANGIPQFQDGVVKFDIATEKTGIFSLWGISGKSKIYIKDPELNDSSKFSATTDNFQATMYATGASNLHYFGKNTSGKLTLSVSGSKKKVSSSDIYRSGYDFNEYNLVNSEGQYLANYTLTHKFNARNTIKTGVTYRILHYKNKEVYYDWDDSLYRTSWDKQGYGNLLQGYAHWQFKVTEKLTLNNGLYYQKLMINNSQSLEPRIAAIYQLDKKNKFSIATGLHSQMHDLFVYQTQFYDSINGTYNQTNKNLKFSKSMHLVAGYQRFITSNLRFKAEAYYQHMYHVPVDPAGSARANVYSILNSGADYDFYIPSGVVNKGTGSNIGMELTLERYFNKNYYFLTNLSLLDSKYKGYDKVKRNSAFDIGHVANILVGKEFHLDEKNRRVISIDLKVTHSGGRRIIGIDTIASKAKGYEELDFNQAYTVKLKNYFRTDLKISYNINRPSTTHNFFIAADNMFNTKNVLTQSWDTNKNKIVTSYQMGIFPYLGYKIQF